MTQKCFIRVHLAKYSYMCTGLTGLNTGIPLSIVMGIGFHPTLGDHINFVGHHHQQNFTVDKPKENKQTLCDIENL